jgi:hypothetical protein
MPHRSSPRLGVSLATSGPATANERAMVPKRGEGGRSASDPLSMRAFGRCRGTKGHQGAPWAPRTWLYKRVCGLRGAPSGAPTGTIGAAGRLKTGPRRPSAPSPQPWCGPATNTGSRRRLATRATQRGGSYSRVGITALARPQLESVRRAGPPFGSLTSPLGSASPLRSQRALSNCPPSRARRRGSRRAGCQRFPGEGQNSITSA